MTPPVREAIEIMEFLTDCRWAAADRVAAAELNQKHASALGRATNRPRELGNEPRRRSSPTW
jgi:hypothetical protein